MSEIILPESGQPLKFPNYREEMYARSQEFRRLSPDEQMKYFQDIIGVGMTLLSFSPKRDIADQMFLKREAEWQRIQRELIANATK